MRTSDKLTMLDVRGDSTARYNVPVRFSDHASVGSVENYTDYIGVHAVLEKNGTTHSNCLAIRRSVCGCCIPNTRCPRWLDRYWCWQTVGVLQAIIISIRRISLFPIISQTSETQPSDAFGNHSLILEVWLTGLNARQCFDADRPADGFIWPDTPRLCDVTNRRTNQRPRRAAVRTCVGGARCRSYLIPRK